MVGDPPLEKGASKSWSRDLIGTNTTPMATSVMVFIKIEKYTFLPEMIFSIPTTSGLGVNEVRDGPQHLSHMISSDTNSNEGPHFEIF